jgi:uncharacterized protein YfbU (UPF0304 family)
MEPLSETELTILLNQYRILDLLDPEDKDGNHWKSKIDILEHHYTHLYDRYIGSFPYLEDVSDTIYSTVNQVLDLYAALQRSAERMAEGKRLDVTFPGFFGNDEIEYLHLAKDLLEVDPLAYPVNPKDDSLNSHGPMIPKYDKMISVWENEFNKMPDLNGEQIAAILEAGK